MKNRIDRSLVKYNNNCNTLSLHWIIIVDYNWIIVKFNLV